MLFFENFEEGRNLFLALVFKNEALDERKKTDHKSLNNGTL